jgi:hypothetical protein
MQEIFVVGSVNVESLILSLNFWQHCLLRLFKKNINNIPWYGRYDDWLTLIDTLLQTYIITTIDKELKTCAENDIAQITLLDK